jgi:putative lipoic acid-binding regulatory protein
VSIPNIVQFPVSTRESTLETLNESHSFPCDYQFKAIGENSPQFVADVEQVAVDVLGESADPEVTTQESGGGTYVSVRMTVVIEQAESILEIYDGVRDLDALKMAL